VRKDNLRIFGISFVMLFIEMFLIRWISTEIRIFAYFSNLVLLACFLGIGIGCYFSRKQANVFITISILTFFACSVSLPAFQSITQLLSGFSDSVIWDQTIRAGSFVPAIYGITLTVFIFILILGTFIPLGQIFGKLMDEHGNIIYAYSVNIIASLLGIWGFNIFSFFSTPPWIWFAFALCILVFFVPRAGFSYLFVLLAIEIILLSFGVRERAPLTVWSPYQKLEIYNDANKDVRNGYILKVNNTNYMSLSNLSEDFTKHFPAYYTKEMVRFNQYTIPYLIAPSKNNVLIVGSGGGNDVAAALRNGAKSIDAVEIDPGIVALGSRLHPEKPYNDIRVNVVIDDARAFFRKAKKRYDIISFGLLDSHTLGSNYNNIRLDHYVYTRESFEEAKKLLSEDGIITVSFAVTNEWIGDRIYRALSTVFGDVPYTFAASYTDLRGVPWGSLVFVTGKNTGEIKKIVEAKPELRDYIFSAAYTLPGKENYITDDWPYLYLQNRGIPKLYLIVSICVLSLIFITKRFLIDRGENKINMHFFFLGSAFLLLEFQNISKVSLLLGSTWIANAYIISAILIIVLLANIVAYHVPSINVKWCYVLLFTSIIFLYFLPLDFFNNFSYFVKSISGALILNFPIFFASIIFITSFKKTSNKNIAFGSNLIGATVGGVLECISFVVGIKALLFVVFFLYALSFFSSGIGGSGLVSHK
jgi:spermidine synthase